MKEEHIEVEGRVTTVLPGTMFRVELDNKHLVLATVCGKMTPALGPSDRWRRRLNREMSPDDPDKARITWRLREFRLEFAPEPEQKSITVSARIFPLSARRETGNNGACRSKWFRRRS